MCATGERAVQGKKEKTGTFFAARVEKKENIDYYKYVDI